MVKMTSVSALPVDQLQQEITRLLALVGQKEETIQQQKASIQNLQHQLHLFRTARFCKKEGLAHQVVKLVGKLYHLERELKDKQATPEIILMRREQEAMPVLAQIKELLDDAQLKVPPKSPLGTAVFY
jgi:chromosome segregation ATPase